MLSSLYLKTEMITKFGFHYFFRVTSHISYKIEQPKQSKPNEGILFINVDVGSMGAPNFDNRPSDLNVTLNRLVEKCIIDSRCVDLESLCIVSEEKVIIQIKNPDKSHTIHLIFVIFLGMVLTSRHPHPKSCRKPHRMC